jgi:hypothetical protein
MNANEVGAGDLHDVWAWQLLEEFKYPQITQINADYGFGSGRAATLKGPAFNSRTGV